MNRNVVNMLFAFLVIVLSFRFFTSKMYYEKILKKPYPFENKQVTEEKQVEKKGEVPGGSDIFKQEILSEDMLTSVPVLSELLSIDSLVADTVSLDTVWIETDKLICGISEEGGRIVSLKTKEFTYYADKKAKKNGKYIELVPQDNSTGGANLTLNEKDFDKEIFLCESEGNEISVQNGRKKVIEFVYTGNNKQIVKEYTFSNGEYRIGYRVKSPELDGKNVLVGWKCGITESEKSSGRSAQFDKRKVHLYDGKNAEYLTMKKTGKEERTGYYNWVGITSKYFLVAVIPEDVRDAEIEIESFEIKDSLQTGKKNVQYNYSIVTKRFASGNEESYWIYAGPSKLTEMKQYKIGLQKVLFRGYRWFFWADKWFPYICEFVLWLLIQLQKGVKDYGIVIIILTIILKIVTYPLTQSSMKSMGKMKETQPRISKIREKHKGNPQQMNQKIMEFYKKEGINPLGGMGGCLPMILQMPIMISLFIVLRKAIELRGQGTFLIPWVKDLSQAEVLFPIGINIPMYGSNFALMPVIMAVLMYFQNKSTIKDPNQKAMIYMMPVMMLVLFNNFPSGLCLYFTFSTALQLLQQKFMGKKKKPSQ